MSTNLTSSMYDDVQPSVWGTLTSSTFSSLSLITPRPFHFLKLTGEKQKGTTVVTISCGSNWFFCRLGDHTVLSSVCFYRDNSRHHRLLPETWNQFCQLAVKIGTRSGLGDWPDVTERYRHKKLWSSLGWWCERQEPRVHRRMLETLLRLVEVGILSGLGDLPCGVKGETLSHYYDIHQYVLNSVNDATGLSSCRSLDGTPLSNPENNRFRNTHGEVTVRVPPWVYQRTIIKHEKDWLSLIIKFFTKSLSTFPIRQTTHWTK